MIKLKEAVIVEGKYDKITLENVIDAVIIPTDGFGIFKDKDKCHLIRRLAEEKGIIVMTDSDSAGAVIRAYLKNIASGGKITNVYIPQLRGKEHRKSKPGCEGLLGVEGMTPQVIENALTRSGITGTYNSNKEKSRKITKTDMFLWGLSGAENSADNRRRLLKRLELPQNMSPNAMLDILNTFYNYDELEGLVAVWLHEADKKLK